MTSGRGKVYLVGAGPGDPGLITLRGVECLCEADVVLYDYLVNPQLLEHARPEAEKVCLGRHGQGRIMSQSEVNATMIEHARRGGVVVRLKGGDPSIFAREAEETEALLAEGIPLEIVPGITAGLAAGSYAGVPITHRDLASCVAFVTGQQQRGKVDSDLDYHALAQFPGTLVFYMGVTTAPQWTAALVSAGKPPQTPAAIVRRCSWPDQQTVRCTLADVPHRLAAERIRPPVIVIVGAVVQSTSTLDWFTGRPLFGQTVLVTRPKMENVADPLRRQLADLGACVLDQPTVAISDPPDEQAVDAAIRQLDTFDWLVFSSGNGVRYFLQRIDAIGLDLRQLGGVKLAVMGPATAEALRQFGLKADCTPQVYRAEALVEVLRDQVRGQRVLAVRASRGRDVIPRSLSAAGADVSEVIAYTSSDVTQPAADVTAALAAGNIDWTTVTSSAIARSLVRMLGDDLSQTRLVTISPLTSGVLRELGHAAAAEADPYTTDGVVKAIVRQVRGR